MTFEMRDTRLMFETAIGSGLWHLAEDILEDAKPFLSEAQYYQWQKELLEAKREDLEMHE